MVTEGYTNGYSIKKTETDTQVQAAAHDLGNPRRLVAADQADPREVLASETHGPAPRQLEVDPQRHHLPDAVRLPVGPVAPQVRTQEHRPRLVSAWCAGGVMKQIWAVLVSECDELGGVQWEWQAADGWLGKARFGGGKGGQKPDGSREKGHEEVRAGGRRGWAVGAGHRGRERPRLQDAAGDDRGHRGEAAPTHGQAPATLESGQGV